jgi:hypothetical protein
MSSFDDRERAAEAKFAHDAEMRFRARARRDKLIGLWVGETFLGKTGDAAESYAKEVVNSNFERPGDDDMVEFVLESVEGVAAGLTEQRLRHKMEELMREAERQLSEE